MTPETLHAQQPPADGPSVIPLATIWAQLTEGICSVTDTFFSSARCYLVVRSNARVVRQLGGTRLAILERILSGQSQKVVAIESGVAPSTVSLVARGGLTALGVSCKPSRAHPLLMLAARAAHELDFTVRGSLCFGDGGDSAVRVISVRRPEVYGVSGKLSNAECLVAQLLVEGRTYAEMCRSRGTSARTLANQICSIFRKFSVSGRNELVHSLFASQVQRGLPREAQMCSRTPRSPIERPRPRAAQADLRMRHVSNIHDEYQSTLPVARAATNGKITK
jgi:DNA-binding NarL/FixJ family response regulator